MVFFYLLLCKNYKQAYKHTAYSRKSRPFAVVHKNGLWQDFAKYHIQHSTAGKTKTECQPQWADFTQHIAQ